MVPYTYTSVGASTENETEKLPEAERSIDVASSRHDGRPGPVVLDAHIGRRCRNQAFRTRGFGVERSQISTFLEHFIGIGSARGGGAPRG